ncbi:hypothetical protein BAUCODRAFT_274506 [Baudoinia panamericana UAMH 10762]|uniref:Uncharacterized protein n=1 Tax=Baudoinia panamericana (strain UAMH 10762) TaxID=717646 RepID=M2M6Y8_BAUPA|nr:uncharacterized protein BAUCODRAFT_274506 [Baudoinia panamericana UAMH 10762]EMC92036.1 hypothetical protein BAUCODRAFT_274506 [Baudoinia panamericana UAMH 10762]
MDCKLVIFRHCFPLPSFALACRVLAAKHSPSAGDTCFCLSHPPPVITWLEALLSHAHLSLITDIRRPVAFLAIPLKTDIRHSRSRSESRTSENAKERVSKQIYTGRVSSSRSASRFSSRSAVARLVSECSQHEQELSGRPELATT